MRAWAYLCKWMCKKKSAYNKWIRACLITGAKRCIWDTETKYISCDILVICMTSLHHCRSQYTSLILPSPPLPPTLLCSTPTLALLKSFTLDINLPTPTPYLLPASSVTSLVFDLMLEKHDLPPSPPPPLPTSEAKVICHVKMQIRARSSAPLSGTKAQRLVKCCQCDAWSCTCKSLATHAIACQQRHGRIIHDYSIEGTSAPWRLHGPRGTARQVRENCCIPCNRKVFVLGVIEIIICSCFSLSAPFPSHTYVYSHILSFWYLSLSNISYII